MALNASAKLLHVVVLWQRGLTPCPVPMFHDLEVFKVSWIFLVKVYHEPTRFGSVLHLPPSCSLRGN